VAGDRLLVPLSQSVTVRQTVSHAVDRVAGGELHFVVAVPFEADVPEGSRMVTEAEELLDRATSWAREDAGGELSVETAVLGTDEYLFGPRDYAETFAAYAADHGIDELVLDPEYDPGTATPLLQPLGRELSAVGLAYETAPVTRPTRRERLPSAETLDRYVALFGVSFLFYLILGDPTYWFDLVTGVAVAAVVSVSLARVTFTAPPRKVNSPLRVLRFSLYVPYLVFEIVKANLAISLVILHPRMPIEPRMTRVNARVRSGLPLLALANSITLTPGTLTVRASDQRLVVHTLIASAREDLFDGGLERAIRFVFYGRKWAAIPTPRERGDAEILGGEES